MNKKSTIRYFATVILTTFIGFIALSFMHTSFLAVLFSIPASIPAFLSDLIWEKFNVDFGTDRALVMGAILLLTNVIIFIPLLFMPRFKNQKNCIVTQSIVLAIYGLASIPYFLKVIMWIQ